MSLGRLFFLVCGVFLLATGVADAATGAEIPELTGPAMQIFEGFRYADFVRIVGVVIFAVLLFAMMGGFVSAGFVPIMIGLIALGGWFGAEGIADTIFTSAVTFNGML